MKPKRIAVIGAGLGGLSAALHLSHGGHTVHVFEKGASAGGKAQELTIDGFRFDTGPSLFTMPQVFERVFAAVDERLSEQLNLVPLEPICTYFYPDGTVFGSSSDRELFGQRVGSNTRDSSEALFAYLDYAGRIHDTAAHLFLWNSLHEAGTYLRGETLKSILQTYRIDPFRTMDAANASFFSDPKMVQLFDRYATYNGSDPYQVPATLNIIPYVEHHFGGFAVDGGIYRVVRVFERLARERGTVFHYETPVTGILHDGGMVTGVATAEGSEPFDVVISNADVLLTYQELLNDPDAPMAQRYRKLAPSSSGIAFYWGMDRSFPKLTVNNILFSPDYPTEFRQIFGEERVPEDPTVYINITSKVTSADAPSSGENWFVLVNTPYDGGQDWDREVAVVRKRIIHTIEERLGAPVSPHISREDVLTPRDIACKTNTHRGSLYGIASNTRFAAFLRHPNRSRRYRGLYFVGGSAHPGGGMPLVVLSGAITAELVERHER